MNMNMTYYNDYCTRGRLLPHSLCGGRLLVLCI